MGKLPRKKRRTVILYAGPDNNPGLIKYRCTVKRATRIIKLLGYAPLVHEAKCGKPIGCYFSELSMFRKDSFMHPVRLAYFTASRAYIIDTVNDLGHPKTVVEYRHDEGRFIDMNDTGALKRMSKVELEKFGQRILTLYPLELNRKPAITDKPKPRGPHEREHGALIIPRGARKRFEKAGLLSSEVVEQLDDHPRH